MDVCINPLNQITPWKHDWAIRVKIVCIWEEMITSEEGEYKVLQMILMDGNLDKIQATVGNVDINGFSDILKEKGVYLITNFKVIPNAGTTRITKHRFQILFHDDTSVLGCPGAEIADNGFTLCSIDHLLQKRIDNDYLVGEQI